MQRIRLMVHTRQVWINRAPGRSSWPLVLEYQPSHAVAAVRRQDRRQYKRYTRPPTVSEAQSFNPWNAGVCLSLTRR